MPRILVVEGLTDATFFQDLLSRLYLGDTKVEYGRQPGRRNIPTVVRGTQSDGTILEVEFRNQEGRSNIPDAIRELLTQGVLSFAVAQDIDDRSPEQTLQSIQGTVYSHLGLNPPRGPAAKKIVVEGRTVDVIPIGLYQDATLTSLGITRHAMEDYLIKVFLEDAGLRQRAPELQGLLSEILPTIRRFDGSFNSSKELFQLIKPVVQHGFSDTGVVNKCFTDADPDILRSVLAPVLADVEQTLSLQ
jgi:hypothetical protein